MTNIIIVIPVLNEIVGVRDLIKRINALKLGNHYLFVDDGSLDGSREFLQSLNKKNPERYRLRFRDNKKKGLGNAYRDAIGMLQKSEYQYILLMDGDGSHDPESIPGMLKIIAEGDFDLVVGSGYCPGGKIEKWSLYRRAISRFGNLFCNLVTGIFYVKDWTTGFKLWNKKMLDSIVGRTTANGYSFLVEATFYSLKTGARVSEFPITFKKRIGGESKFSFKIFFEALRVILKMR
jgi:dolichol-phosphate mannosyltransferase